MTVRLSREPGRFSVLLKEVAWLDPSLIAPELSKALGLPRSDTIRACRVQRGVLFEGATRQQADATVATLKTFDIASKAISDSDVPLLPRPANVSLSRIEDDGLATPSLRGAGLPQTWDWNRLAMVVGGILIDPDMQTPGLFDRVDDESVSELADRQSMASRQLDKARGRVFPMKQEIENHKRNVGEALEAALAGKGASGNYVVEGFGKIDTVLDFVFLTPFDRLRITGRGRIAGLEHSPSKARNLHVALKRISPLAPGATQPGGTLALVHGADSGDYVFEDIVQFDAYCRWVYHGRLKLLNEFDGLRMPESDNAQDSES